MQKIISKGFNAVVPERMNDIYGHNPLFKRVVYRFLKLFSSKPKFCFNYEKAAKYFVKDIDRREDVIPQIIPQWDHSPRSATRGTILHKSTPKKFAKHVEDVLHTVEKKKNKIIFLKSWNEWAEGNYMEPDMKFGKGYIMALKKVLDKW